MTLETRAIGSAGSEAFASVAGDEASWGGAGVKEGSAAASVSATAIVAGRLTDGDVAAFSPGPASAQHNKQKNRRKPVEKSHVTG
jgi:hypothetical protein